MANHYIPLHNQKPDFIDVMMLHYCAGLFKATNQPAWLQYREYSGWSVMGVFTQNNFTFEEVAIKHYCLTAFPKKVV